MVFTVRTLLAIYANTSPLLLDDVESEVVVEYSCSCSRGSPGKVVETCMKC